MGGSKEQGRGASRGGRGARGGRGRGRGGARGGLSRESSGRDGSDREGSGSAASPRRRAPRAEDAKEKKSHPSAHAAEHEHADAEHVGEAATEEAGAVPAAVESADAAPAAAPASASAAAPAKFNYRNAVLTAAKPAPPKPAAAAPATDAGALTLETDACNTNLSPRPLFLLSRSVLCLLCLISAVRRGVLCRHAQATETAYLSGCTYTGARLGCRSPSVPCCRCLLHIHSIQFHSMRCALRCSRRRFICPCAHLPTFSSLSFRLQHPLRRPLRPRQPQLLLRPARLQRPRPTSLQLLQLPRARRPTRASTRRRSTLLQLLHLWLRLHHLLRRHPLCLLSPPSLLPLLLASSHTLQWLPPLPSRSLPQQQLLQSQQPPLAARLPGQRLHRPQQTRMAQLALAQALAALSFCRRPPTTIPSQRLLGQAQQRPPPPQRLRAMDTGGKSPRRWLLVPMRTPMRRLRPVHRLRDTLSRLQARCRPWAHHLDLPWLPHRKPALMLQLPPPPQLQLLPHRQLPVACA